MVDNQLIWTKSNVLESSFCDHIIQKFENDSNKSPGKVLGSHNSTPVINNHIKSSTDLHITTYHENWKNEDTVLYESLQTPLKEYRDYCSRVLNNTSLFGSQLNDTGYQIQRTKPGEFYTWHSDHHISLKYGHRMITFIWYLNDIHDEGYTEFFDGTQIQPECGKLLLFPSTWTYSHRGVSPKTETKYICTGWLYDTSVLISHS